MLSLTKSLMEIRNSFYKFGTRRFCAAKSSAPGAEFEKSVYISQSEDIYTNLALEDWFYRNSEFSTHRILLLWKNKNAVVIGRHQNIWTEVDLDLARTQNVAVARRNSGGGSVYHDIGNLNCSFFMPRAQYNRKYNLSIIQRALQRTGVNVEINCKEDLTLNGAKISGTASKLGKNSYHHCTLLVDSDLTSLSALLNPNTEGFVSKATKSVKSPVQNVKASNPAVTVDSLLSTIGDEFLRTDGNGNDGGVELAKRQRGFKYVNPTEFWYPGIDTLRAEFQSWNWRIGKTPEFTVKKSFVIPPSQSTEPVEVELRVLKGLVESAQATQVPLTLDEQKAQELSAYLAKCQGQAFSMDIFRNLECVLLGQEVLVSPGVSIPSSDLTGSTPNDSNTLMKEQNFKTMCAI